MSASPGPSSHWYFSQRLRLHYADFGNDSAPPLVLVHGGRDHCRNWDWVAESLRDRYHVLAPDLRGHGDSEWMRGGSYAVHEFVYDLAQLVEQKGLAPVRIIGHSLGGAVSLMYAGLYPARVERLVAIEGMGPSPELLERLEAQTASERVIEWAAGAHELAGRRPRQYASLQEAVARMREANPRLSEPQARHLTVHGVNQNEDGTYSWKFDNYVRARSPLRFTGEQMATLYARVACPTLLVRGTESWASDPGRDGRAAPFPDARVLNVEGAGHWVHHDRLRPFLDAVEAFFHD